MGQKPRAPAHGVALSRRFCSSRMSRGPLAVTLTAGSTGTFDQNAQGQMLSGMPSLSGYLA
jgi:hypothetical protein